MSKLEFLAECIFMVLFVLVGTFIISASIWSICHFSGMSSHQTEQITGVFGIVTGLILLMVAYEITEIY